MVSILRIIDLIFVCFSSAAAATDRVGRLRDNSEEDFAGWTRRQARAKCMPCNGRPPMWMRCDPACPCCSEDNMPEFVAAIEAFRGRRRNKCNNKDCCYRRLDEESSIISVTTPCHTNPNPPFVYTAFMSFDYTGTYTGCPVVGETCKLCGDSGFDYSPIILTDKQARACEAVLRSSIRDVDLCWTETEDGYLTRDCS